MRSLYGNMQWSKVSSMHRFGRAQAGCTNQLTNVRADSMEIPDLIKNTVMYMKEASELLGELAMSGVDENAKKNS